MKKSFKTFIDRERSTHMKEKVLESLAAEALKPVSSVIDAALAPKIQRIRVNAKKRELKDRLGEKTINDLLEGYFKRLLRRVSGITTLAFPQQQLSLISIYEPLKLKKSRMQGFESYGHVEIISLNAKQLEEGENYLIIDSAGMGKSTFAKYLVLDIFQSSIKIPLFLELRRIGASETLLGKLSKEIDESQEDIDARFLGMLLEQGGYVIILDGFDELSKNGRKRIGEEITELALKYDRNSIILTSRPEVSIPEISNSTVLKIQPLDREQAESLVLRYDAVANITVGKGLIREFNTVSLDFLKTPLLVILLYRTYGYNQTIAAKVTSFYDDMFNAFYKGHDLSKSGFSRPKLSGLDSEDFRRLLRGFCFLLTTYEKNSIASKTQVFSFIEKSIKLTNVVPSSASDFLDDLLLSVPFLMKDGGEYRFIHKSIVDFFTGEFLASSPDAEEIIKNVLAGSILNSFSKAFSFLAEINPSLFRRLIVAPAARAIIEEKVQLLDPILQTLVFFGYSSMRIEADDGKHKKTSLGPDIVERNTSSFEIQKKRYRLLFYRVKKLKLIPWAAWIQISSLSKYSGRLMGHNPYGLVRLLTPGEMYSLRQEPVASCAKDAAVYTYLEEQVHSIFQYEDVRVIDLDACKKMIEATREERETQNWINSLLNK